MADAPHAPHATHLHLWAPDEVLPFLFIDSLQHAHLTAFITHPSRKVFNVSEKGYLSGRTAGARTRFLSECLNAADEFKRTKKGHRPAPMPLNETHFLPYKRGCGRFFGPAMPPAQGSCGTASGSAIPASLSAAPHCSIADRRRAFGRTRVSSRPMTFSKISPTMPLDELCLW